MDSGERLCAGPAALWSTYVWRVICLAASHGDCSHARLQSERARAFVDPRSIGDAPRLGPVVTPIKVTVT